MKIKNFVFYSILILLFTSFTAQYAVAESNPHLVGLSVRSIPDTKEIVVDISGVFFRKINLSITDHEGIVLYKERISNRPHYKKRMVMDLPNGKYILTVEDEKSISKRTIRVQDKIVEIMEAGWSEYSKPVFDQKGELFIIEMTTNTPSIIEVAFLNQEGEALFTENLIVAKHFDRKYDISALTDGPYFVELNNANQTYYSQLVNN